MYDDKTNSNTNPKTPNDPHDGYEQNVFRGCNWNLQNANDSKHHVVGRDGALVESITFNRRVLGSTPALAVT